MEVADSPPPPSAPGSKRKRRVSSSDLARAAPASLGLGLGGGRALGGGGGDGTPLLDAEARGEGDRRAAAGRETNRRDDSRGGADAAAGGEPTPGPRKAARASSSPSPSPAPPCSAAAAPPPLDPPLPDDDEEAALRRKRELLAKLTSEYCRPDDEEEEDDYDDFEGDVSGEDVFSDEEDAESSRRAREQFDAALRRSGSIPAAERDRATSSSDAICQGTKVQPERGDGNHNQRQLTPLNDTCDAKIPRTNSRPGLGRSPGNCDAQSGGGASLEQPRPGSAKTGSSLSPSEGADRGSSDQKNLREYDFTHPNLLGRDEAGRDPRKISSGGEATTSRPSVASAIESSLHCWTSQRSREVRDRKFDGMKPDAMSCLEARTRTHAHLDPWKAYQDTARADVATDQRGDAWTRGLKRPPPATGSRDGLREDPAPSFVRAVADVPRTALSAGEGGSRDVFAHLDARIVEQGGLNRSHHSSSREGWSEASEGSNDGSWRAPSGGAAATLAASGEEGPREFSRTFPRGGTERGEPPLPWGRSTRGFEGATTSSSGADLARRSADIISNMEAVLPPRGMSMAQAYNRWERPGYVGTFQKRMARCLAASRAPSREVIASIEADILRLEEEEKKAEADRGRAASLTDGVRPQRGMSLMMMQLHRRPQLGTMHLAGGHGKPSNRTSDGLAVDPPRLGGADNDSTTSVASCASYDGKCTHVYGIRVTTQEQELACHALNDAICNVYEAPVKAILGRHPEVTRLVRADDEMENVQLHYAVRNGNVKAIRRIVRADPGCALIRNIHGYCPLHFAVQIGNFAAVQLLCCMVPASAEVQCEEGCLPLHEAVSNAAEQPDAPQITAVLINAFPSAVKITNDEGLLPLHLAAMSGFSAGIRTLFAYGFSTIYARENTEDMLPLDFAVDGHKTSLEEANSERRDEAEEKEAEFRRCIDILLLSALYDRPVFAPATNQRDMAFLPIHGAAAAQPCSQSWKHIASMYGRDRASDVDIRGRTALHVLVSSPIFRVEDAIEMIEDINKLDPSNAVTFDDGGLTPLHSAVMHLAPHPVVECLLTCNWSTVSMEVDEDCDREEFCGMLPFQLAAARDCSVDVINSLLRAHPMGVVGALPKIYHHN